MTLYIQLNDFSRDISHVDFPFLYITQGVQVETFTIHCQFRPILAHPPHTHCLSLLVLRHLWYWIIDIIQTEWFWIYVNVRDIARRRGKKSSAFCWLQTHEPQTSPKSRPVVSWKPPVAPPQKLSLTLGKANYTKNPLCFLFQFVIRCRQTVPFPLKITMREVIMFNIKVNQISWLQITSSHPEN